MTTLNGQTPPQIAHQALNEQITDKAARLARQLDVPAKDILAYLKREQYRAQYNSRPEVKEARRQYARQRNQKLSLIKKMVEVKRS